MSYKSRPISFSQDTFKNDYFEVKKVSSGCTYGTMFLCFKSPGRSGNGYSFRGIYKKNSNGKISESDGCRLNDFLPVLRYKLFKGEEGGHLGYRPLLKEEIDYCIDTLKREYEINERQVFNLNIEGEVVNFRENRENKSHAFLSFKKSSKTVENSLFFDSNGDNSFAVTKAGCIKDKAMNTKNIQGQFNSCSYWTICAANEILMSAKKGTFERDLSNGTLHRNILKRFQYIQHCAENNIMVGKFTEDIDILISGVGIDENKYVGDFNSYMSQIFPEFVKRFQREINRARQNARPIRPIIVKPMPNRTKFPALACEDILHSINQETTPVGGGFRGQIAKKGMPGKTVLSAKSLPLSFADSFKIENIQKKLNSILNLPKRKLQYILQISNIINKNNLNRNPFLYKKQKFHTIGEINSKKINQRQICLKQNIV